MPDDKALHDNRDRKGLEDMLVVSGITFSRPAGKRDQPWRSKSGIELKMPPGQTRPEKDVERRLRKCDDVELVQPDEKNPNQWYSPALNHFFVKAAHKPVEEIDALVRDRDKETPP